MRQEKLKPLRFVEAVRVRRGELLNDCMRAVFGKQLPAHRPNCLLAAVPEIVATGKTTSKEERKNQLLALFPTFPHVAIEQEREHHLLR